jgi:predicted RNase H-like HicB family nuclease
VESAEGIGRCGRPVGAAGETSLCHARPLRRLRLNIMSYAIALIHKENGVYGISFPDFPGCVSTGRSIDEAILKGGQALALHVAGMIEDGEPLPALRGVAQLRADPEFSIDFEGATVAQVEIAWPA